VLRARQTAAAVLAAAFLGAFSIRQGVAATMQPSPASGVESQTLDFLIYKPSNTELIGRGRYAVTVTRDSIVIDGRNDLFDGEYDVEHERLRNSGGAEPVLVSYKHSFFGKQGAPQRVARADPPTGKASCTTYQGTDRNVRSEVLQFPADTYAGASVLVPIADQLRHNPSGDLHLHAFDCAPGPRIFTLNVNVQQAPWSHLPQDNDLLKADARPVFGWYDLFLKPFVPKTRFWFDPRRNFGFMGGTMSRYYGGPEIMLVRVPPTLTVPPLAATAPATPPQPAAPSAASPSASLPLASPPAMQSLSAPPATPSLAEAKSHPPAIAAPAAQDTSADGATKPLLPAQ
jgi:hypothetical protein